MKRQLIPVLISALLLLPSCNSVQPPAAESVPESSAPVTSEAVSSEAASSLADSFVPASSEAIFSAAESAAASSLPQSSQEEAPKAEASSAPVSSAPPPVTKKEEPPQKAEPAPPPASASDEPTEQADVQKDNVPEGRRPMTENEINNSISKITQYVNELGMTWDDSLIIESSGYFMPCDSRAGVEIVDRDLKDTVDHILEFLKQDDYFQDVSDIHINVAKGPIEGEDEGVFIYILYC